MPHTSIAAVILAAGQASRMGSPKQLLDWHGQPLVRAVVQQALDSAADTVVGAAFDAVRATLSDLPITIVENPDFAQGQSTSLRSGILALDDTVEAVLVLLADQPFVTASTLDRLISSWHEQRAPIIVPVYQGQRGHPVLFARSVFAELLAITGDQGARHVIQAYRDQVRCIEFAESLALADIDTPEDYRALQTQTRAS
jgi:molybdenum cofactor cytidylyltransferase